MYERDSSLAFTKREAETRAAVSCRRMQFPVAGRDTSQKGVYLCSLRHFFYALLRLPCCAAIRFFNSFEGGGVATNNDELALKCRQSHNFGAHRNSRSSEHCAHVRGTPRCHLLLSQGLRTAPHVRSLPRKRSLQASRRTTRRMAWERTAR